MRDGVVVWKMLVGCILDWLYPLFVGILGILVVGRLVVYHVASQNPKMVAASVQIPKMVAASQ